MSRIGARKAIILAAGVGRRLGAFTQSHPKPLLPINGIPILENCLLRLAESGVDEAVMVVGHLRDQIIAFAGERYGQMRIRYVVSERYASTNNIYSLWLARADLDGDVLLLEADVFFDSSLLPALQALDADNGAAVARFDQGMNGSVVELDAHGYLMRLIEGREQGSGFDYSCVYKTVNIYRFGRDYLADEFVPALQAAIEENRTGDYYERVLKASLQRGRHKVRALDCTPMRWYEIDNLEDKRIAEGLFGAS
jgi:NDP-sugar pyrophosphorylase family protein